MHIIPLTSSVLHRVFPFQRGLFEDKVANFWCCVSVLVKVRDLFEIPTLIRIRYDGMLCCMLLTYMQLGDDRCCDSALVCECVCQAV